MGATLTPLRGANISALPELVQWLDAGAKGVARRPPPPIEHSAEAPA